MAANDNNTNSSEKLPREKRESTDKYNPGNQKGKDRFIKRTLNNAKMEGRLGVEGSCRALQFE